MNRFPDAFQTVTDRSLFGPNVPHSMDTLTRWLTNSVCIAQAPSSSTHSSTVRQTIMSVILSNCTARPECHWNDGPDATSSVFCRSWKFLRLMLTKHRLRNGKLKMTSRADHFTHERSKLLVKRKYSMCGTWRCTGTPPKQRHGHELHATKLASSGSIPTKVAPKLHVTTRVLVCTEVRHKGVEQIFSATPPLETLRIRFCVMCQEDVFRVEDLSPDFHRRRESSSLLC